MLDDLSPARKIAYAVLGVFSAIVLFAAFGSGGGGVDTTAPKATRGTTTTAPTTTIPVPKAFDRTVLPVKLPTATSRSAAVPDGKSGFYLLGGLDVRRAPTSTIVHVDPVANTAPVVGSLTQPVQNHSAVALGERILLYGGGERAALRDIQEYNGTDKAQVVGQLAVGRFGHVAIVAGGRIVIVGGSDGNTDQTEVLASADGITFNAIANLPVGLRFPAVAALDNKVYVFGGEVNGQPVDTVYAIDLANNAAVTQPAKLERPLSHAAAFVVSGGIFFAGGKTDKGLTDYIWRFDPGATPPTFLFAGTLPRPVSDAAAVTVAGKVFLAGGESPSFVQDVVQLTPLNDDSGLLAQLRGSTIAGGSPLPQATVPPRAVATQPTTTTRPTTTTIATTRPPVTTQAPAPTTISAPPTSPATTQATPIATAGSSATTRPPT